MKDSSIESSNELKSKLDLIEKLLQEKKYKETLAEIRDLESSQKISQISSQEQFRFCYFKACVLLYLGNYEEALENGNKAFSIIKDTKDHKNIAQVQYILGLIHVSLGNLKDAEIEIRDSMTGFRRVSDFKGLISALSKLAFIESIKGNYGRSVEFLQDALKYCDQANDETSKVVLYGNLGARYTLMGRWKEAEENLRLNVKLNEENEDDINLARGLLSLGYVCSQQRDFKKANKYYEQAVKIIFENSYAREFAIYNEYAGELEFAQGNYEDAKNHYLNCIGAMEKIAPEGDMISQTYRLLAELQIAEKEYDKALSSCEKALKVAESLGEKIEIGAIHRAWGKIYSELKQKEKAKESFEKSISILQEIGAKFELGKAYLEALRSSAFEYIDRVFYCGNANEVFQELESDYWLGMTSLALCEMFLEDGEYGKADVYLKDAERPFKRAKESKGLESVAELRGKIDRALGRVGSPENPHRAVYLFPDIITDDPPMLALIDQVKKLKDSDAPILILGETGTGKDLLAMAIHCESKRKNKPFVPVSCPSISETLIESELFGHKKGAFTGADKERMGLFESANGGTIFLNEIGDFPLTLQAKILDVIENKRLTRVGESKSRNLDFRVIAATNKNLKEEMKKGYFREDLYHRLNCASFNLSPLRERKKDIPLLVDHFLKKHFGEDEKNLLTTHPQILKIFESYHWPGNVRELENELVRLISLKTDENGIELTSLPDKFFSSEDFDKDDPPESGSLYNQLKDFEKKRIEEALKSTNGNKSQAAKLLNIPLSSMISKIKKHRTHP